MPCGTSVDHVPDGPVEQPTSINADTISPIRAKVFIEGAKSFQIQNVTANLNRTTFVAPARSHAEPAAIAANATPFRVLFCRPSPVHQGGAASPQAANVPRNPPQRVEDFLQ